MLVIEYIAADVYGRKTTVSHVISQFKLIDINYLVLRNEVLGMELGADFCFHYDELKSKRHLRTAINKSHCMSTTVTMTDITKKNQHLAALLSTYWECRI